MNTAVGIKIFCYTVPSFYSLKLNGIMEKCGLTCRNISLTLHIHGEILMPVIWVDFKRSNLKLPKKDWIIVNLPN